MGIKGVRVGIISTVTPENMTARVAFPDEIDTASGKELVSGELVVLGRGTRGTKDFWMPNVGDQVVCLFPENGKNAGYIAGTIFNAQDRPPEGAGKGKLILEHDGDMLINCTGVIKINGRAIHLNEGG
ncbi:MAG: phage baseplate assembly protein V [Acidaminococcaceae bacterium]